MIALSTDYVSNHLSAIPRQRVRFINQSVLRSFSSILHGEQGALNLSASLCHVLKDQGAQEYAANQTREEARHVTAFAKYIKARWGKPVECGPALKTLLVEIIGSARGLQEDHRHADAGRGPGHGRLRHLLQPDQRPGRQEAAAAGDDRRGLPPQVREDLGRPHRAQAVAPKEHAIIEDWAAHCFQTLLFNLVSPHQQLDLYREFGLDPDKVVEEYGKIMTDDVRRENMKEQTNIFRVLVKTLLNAGIITDRTKAFYAMYVDLAELKDEGERMVGDDIAEEGIRYLQAINFKDRPVAPVSIAAE